jgi:hypothetical protein
MIIKKASVSCFPVTRGTIRSSSGALPRIRIIHRRLERYDGSSRKTKGISSSSQLRRQPKLDQKLMDLTAKIIRVTMKSTHELLHRYWIEESPRRGDVEAWIGPSSSSISRPIPFHGTIRLISHSPRWIANCCQDRDKL